jgi:hypothetical protein
MIRHLSHSEPRQSGIFLTNQIHSWAHVERPPRIVRALQRKGLILGTTSADTPPVQHLLLHHQRLARSTARSHRFFERIHDGLRRVLEPVFGVADEVGAATPKS